MLTSLELPPRFAGVALGQMYPDNQPMRALSCLLHPQRAEGELQGRRGPPRSEQLVRCDFQHMQLKLPYSFPLEQYPVVIPARQQLTLRPKRAEIHFHDGLGPVDDLECQRYPAPVIHLDTLVEQQLAVRGGQNIWLGSP